MAKHRLDAVSLMSGLLFTGLGLVFLADRIRVTDLYVRGAWPVLLVLVGLWILLSSRGRGREDDEPVAEEEPGDEAGVHAESL